MPDFAVRVRGAKGRSWRSPRRLVAVYLGLWVFALVVFLLMAQRNSLTVLRKPQESDRFLVGVSVILSPEEDVLRFLYTSLLSMYRT